MSSASEVVPPASVVAAIVVGDATALTETLEAVRRQVYEPAGVCIVGGSRSARGTAEAENVKWVPDMERLLDAISPTITHIWVIHDDSLPRPDALHALVVDGERVGAGIATSKILDRFNESRLISVGVATDVFDTPYTGLDQNERDQGQYDVVRDVAAASGVSMLVRRDLMRGLGGSDGLMAPEAAAIDLSQRARLRGARIVVVPSSEVLYPPGAVRAQPWREEAGRIRAMSKAYGPLTLLWALPLDFLIGLFEAIAAPFLGRWTLWAWIRSWLWNVWHLPSTFTTRRQARRRRAAGDSELFRYQLRGSVTLKEITSEAGERVRARLPGEDRLSLEALGRDLRRPAFIAGLLALLFVLVATRSIWSGGLPAVQYSLPFPTSGWDGVMAYAGGWNPAEFGSIEPLRPLIGAVGAVQAALFDNRRLAEYVMVAGAYSFGIWGTVRLLRTWSIAAFPGVIAGVVLVAGGAAQGVAHATEIGTLFALGALPWALRIPLARWPRRWLARIGRVAAMAVVTGILAMLNPVLLVFPSAALVLWALININDGAAWRAALVAILGGALAVPLLLPWVAVADLERFIEAGSLSWNVPSLTAAGFLIAALATVIAAPARLALVGGWGAVLAAGGVLLAALAGSDVGAAVGAAGLASASVGSAAVVGAVIEALSRVKEVAGWRRMAIGIGSAASVLVVLTALLVILGGRAGLPGDRYTEVLGFTSARPGDPADHRTLVLGDPALLPGDARTLRGAGYRVVSASVPELDEAWLAQPRGGDEALAASLERIIDGDTLRAGSELAPFGIRWIVIMGEGDPHARAWSAVFEGQLDLVPLGGGLSSPTFANEEPALRAVTDSGEPWPSSGVGYAGEANQDGRVLLAENANSRWGPPEWVQVDWRNEVSAAEGVAEFDPLQSRRGMALVAGLGFLILFVVAFVGRRVS